MVVPRACLRVRTSAGPHIAADLVSLALTLPPFPNGTLHHLQTPIPT